MSTDHLISLKSFRPSILPEKGRRKSRDRELASSKLTSLSPFLFIGLLATSPVQRLSDRYGRRMFLVGLPLLDVVSIGLLLFACELDFFFSPSLRSPLPPLRLVPGSRLHDLISSSIFQSR